MPNDKWRAVWQTIKTQLERDQAVRLITEALYIAATQDQEATVAQYLEIQLQSASMTLAELQRTFKSSLDAEQLPWALLQKYELSQKSRLAEFELSSNCNTYRLAQLNHSFQHRTLTQQLCRLVGKLARLHFTTKHALVPEHRHLSQ